MLGFFLTSAHADQFTGCLSSKGEIDKVAIGTVPSKPCKTKETLITWNSEGPQGPAGPIGLTGATGATGPAGADGNDFADGVLITYGNVINYGGGLALDINGFNLIADLVNPVNPDVFLGGSHLSSEVHGGMQLSVEATADLENSLYQVIATLPEGIQEGEHRCFLFSG